MQFKHLVVVLGVQNVR